jgi:eukaryotic-like serine/threonine-protein kinase
VEAQLPESAETAGTQIGRYKLLQAIGEGGMGTVWMAEQREPVKRRVALKLIKLGMDTKQVIARFEAERQALALMDHPNIARVLDAGATETGRPYFVMEYIRGVPILEYCDTEKLDTNARLELFTRVCQAIQHAHQKGIIHRDIKPSNVLVTLHDGVALPKVIDFGIAKATSSELTTRTLFTEHRQMIGTPAYMSPEQAEMTGLDIDTRSDIYSLGVLLYELLTGTTPFDIERLLQKGYGEMMRAIREETPHKPSTRISNLGDTATRTAVQRQVDVKRLGLVLRGDLDWIVMRCLEKDRTRRYETASALAADIERHLRDEPVSAGPPSAAYRLQKFVKRNRAGVLAAGLVAVVLVLGVVGTTWGMLRALDERARADGEAQKAQETARFALSLFKGIDADIARGADTTLLLKILDDARERISRELAAEPDVEAEIRTTLGRAYTQLARFDDAEHELRAAEALRLRLFGEQDRRTLDTRDALATLLVRRGKEAAGEALQRETLEHQQQALGRDHRDALATQSDLGASLMRQGKFREAEQLLREALGAQREQLGSEDKDTLSTQLVLAQTLDFEDKSKEAHELLEPVYELRRARLGDDAPETIIALETLACSLHGLGRNEESEAAHREVLERSRRVYGPEDQQTLSVMNNLAICIADAGKAEEAEALHRECLAARRKKLGDEHVDTLSTMNNLGRLLYDHGRNEEADALFAEAFEKERHALGEDHRLTMQARFYLASARKRERRYAEAAELLGQIVACDRRLLAEDDTNLALAIYNWAGTLQDAGDFAGAEAPLRDAVALVEKHGWESERFVPATWNALAKSLEKRGEHAEADVWFAKALAARRELHPPSRTEVGYSLVDWGAALLERGTLDQAEPLLREYLELQRKLKRDKDWHLPYAQALFGRCLARRGRFTDAEEALRPACETYAGIESPGAIASEARGWLVELYEEWDKAEPGKGIAARADAWRAREPERNDK